MHDHTLKLLEFDKVRAAIAGMAQLQATRARIDRFVQPATDRAAIVRRRDAITELVGLLLAGHDVTMSEMIDPQQWLQRARIVDSFLSAAELLNVRTLLDNIAAVRRFYNDHKSQAPLVAALVERLETLPELRRALDGAIDDDGQVRDDASPELRRIRIELRQVRQRLERRLQAMLSNPDFQDALAGDRPTQRGGRLVLPVKANRWTAIGGLVHDRSNTGQTFFVEPAATIEMGNDLQNHAAEEESEVRRILADLTARLRPHLDSLLDGFNVLVNVDFLRAAANYSRRWNMLPPDIAADGAALELIDARHVLLQSTLVAQKRQDELVPLSLTLKEPIRTLAVTGSNTGGKTVTLKTVGLIALMAQSGLHVPARRAVLPIFDEVLVDIGDEQSIEQSLSTFSGHMSQIVRIMAQAGPRSLVLLDELGSGTDPAEGGALACAILERLARAGSHVMVTTHLREVKIFCQDQPSMMNAAMEFDMQSLRPTYRLIQGEPGQSHAVAIARRLGLPEEVVATAERHLSDEHLNMERLLSRLNEDRRLLRENLEQAERDRRQAALDRQSLTDELADLKKGRKNMLREAYAQASGIVTNAERQMQQLLREIRSQGAEGPKVEDVRRRMRERRQKLSHGADQLSERQRPRLQADDLRPGQAVYVERFRGNGRIETVDRRKNRVTVNVNGLTLEISPADLSLPDTAAVQADERKSRGGAGGGASSGRKSSAGQAPLELNIIGHRVAEAMLLLEQFIDTALLADYAQVYIIHGRGTGALMKAVHDLLRQHPQIESFRSGNETEGGIAVTVAKFKE